MSAKTMLYECQNTAFFDEKWGLISSLLMVQNYNSLIVNKLITCRFFHYFAPLLNYFEKTAGI